MRAICFWRGGPTGTYRLVESQPGGYVDGPDFPGDVVVYNHGDLFQRCDRPHSSTSRNGLGQNYRFGERAYVRSAGQSLPSHKRRRALLGRSRASLYTPIILDGVNDLGESILITGARAASTATALAGCAPAPIP